MSSTDSQFVTCTDCGKETPEKDSFQFMESREMGYEVPSQWDGTMVPATEMVETAILCLECAQKLVGPDGPQLKVKGVAQ